MKSKATAWGYTLAALALAFAACERRVPMPTLTQKATPTRAAEQEWPLPADKYVFIERWIEIYEDSAVSACLDFPTYRFDQSTGELGPDIVPSGRWFPLEDITELRVVYGRGTQRTGSAGTGANSQVFAVTSVLFAEPPRGDADAVVTVESVDTRGVAYLRRGGGSG